MISIPEWFKRARLLSDRAAIVGDPPRLRWESDPIDLHAADALARRIHG